MGNEDIGECMRVIELRRYASTHHAITSGQPRPGLPFAAEFAAFKLEEMRRRAGGG